MSQAHIISKALGLQEYDEKNLKGLCPFHKEDTPSFVYNRKNNSFHCFGCGKTVDIIDTYMECGKTYVEAVQILFEQANIQYNFGEHKIKTQKSYKYPKEERHEMSKVYEYLAKRRISQRTADYLQIGADSHGNIAFHYYDLNDVLTLVKYRPSKVVEKGENKNWVQKDSDSCPLLYNINRINTSSPLLITCGELDCAAAIEAGYTNTVSIPFGDQNTHWVEYCWDWIEQFNSIIICHDNDSSGIKFYNDILYRLGSWRCKVVNLPSIYQRDKKEYPIKDLNEYLYFAGREATMDLILNAKDTPIDSIIDFADIKDVELEEVEGIKTGIKEFDKEIMRLFYGTFTVLTGINGAGKTSFLSQVTCQALEQNKNVWFYSGELPNDQTKNWISYILTGQRHLSQMSNEDDAVYWRIPKGIKEQLNEFYRGRLWIYKDGFSRRTEDLLNTMEAVVRKNDVKLLILDNLTAINLGNNDHNKYEKQTEFINTLVDFAKKFNVAVILVVHPHKMDTTRRMTKMDLQGSMALSDLAHRVFGLYRVQQHEKEGVLNAKGDGWLKEPIKYDVILDILKDRMRGREGKSFGLYYDMPSKRFFTDLNDLDHKYQWDDKIYDTSIPYFPPQLCATDDSEAFGRVV